MKKFICLVVMLLIVFVVNAFAATVPEGHVGIKVTFGKAENDILMPGFYLTGPFTSVKNMDTRWQKYKIKTSAFSKDIQQVDVEMSASYSLAPDGALAMYKNVGLDYSDKIMYPIIIESLKSVMAKFSAEELVSRREEISSMVYNEIHDALLIYKLTVREVAIEDIDFTDAFTDAIEAKQVATQRKLQVRTEEEQKTMVAQEEAKRAKIAEEAAAEQMLIAARAEAEAKRMTAEAEAYRLEQENKFTSLMNVWKTLAEEWDGTIALIRK